MSTETNKQRGRLDEVWAQEGYGVLVTPDGERLRFDHRDVEKRDFDLMKVGAEVEFEREAEGTAGPRAVGVRLVE